MIEFISLFWLCIWDLVFPFIGIVYLIGSFLMIVHFIKRKIDEKKKWEEAKRKELERNQFIQKFEIEGGQTLNLTRRQILDGIILLLKQKASYKIMTPSGNYNSSYDREVLIEYYQEFFKALGFE